jgi:predicted DNA binding protein
MRYLRLTVTDDVISPSPAVIRGAVLNMRQLRDGTILELYRVEGDVDALATECEENPDCLQYEICDVDERQCYVSLHCRPDEQMRDLYALLDTYTLMIDLPIRFEAGTGVTVRLIGDEAMLQQAFQALPEAVRTNTTIEQFGEYVPETPEIRTVLTDRQLEVLEAGVSVGYYATPRCATATDVAERVGCARSTVSEHLRNIEARLVMALSSASQMK